MPDSFNATRITERLIVGGGLVGPAEVDWLAEQGVTAIISAAAELDDSLFASESHERGSIATLHIPWQDDGQAKPDEDFWHAYQWLAQQEAKQILAGRSVGVYVHCAAGVNRGPLLATYLLAQLSGLPGDTAWAFVKGQREQVQAFNNPAYRKSALDALERHRPFYKPAPVVAETVSVTDAVQAVPEAAEAPAEAAPAEVVSAKRK